MNYEGLKRVIAEHKAVRIYPSFWCDPGADHSFKRFFHLQVEYSSSIANVESNSAVMARKTKDCVREAKNKLVLQPGELNIFLSRATARAALDGREVDPTEVCRSFPLDAGVALMCASDWKRDTPLPIPELTAFDAFAPERQVGAVIQFGKNGNESDMLGDGWWPDHEPDRSWTEGEVSSLFLKLPDVPSSSLTVAFNAVAFLHPPQINNRTVNVAINGRGIATWNFIDGAWHEEQISLPSGLDGQEIKITFLQTEIRSPKELTGGNDPRRLGIAIRSLALRPR